MTDSLPQEGDGGNGGNGLVNGREDSACDASARRVCLVARVGLTSPVLSALSVMLLP